jgi:hypothetical protein
MNTSRIQTAKVLVALGAVSMALAAAGPANADINRKPPVDENGKKSCGVSRGYEGDRERGYYYVPHGYVMRVRMPNGAEGPEVRCDDGNWVVHLPAPTTPTHDPSDTTGTYERDTLRTPATEGATSPTTVGSSEPTP